jgi:hypothetical protein
VLLDLHQRRAPALTGPACRSPARSPARGRSRLAAALVAVLATAGAAAAPVRVDTWDTAAPGPLHLSGTWRRYPDESRPFTHPPAIVLDDGRPVLHLQTAGEAMRIGRPVTVDLRATPWLTWEWKPLVLPEGGDVRHSRRNDQAGRVMVVFEGLTGLLYVWDTTAPVGTEAGPEALEIFQRVLVVVRSGPDGLGQWWRERRNVLEDYRRLFDTEPRGIRLVGVESHSNDTGTRTAMRFGRLQFEP